MQKVHSNKITKPTVGEVSMQLKMLWSGVKKDVIVKTFKKCSISVDGTEGDAMMIE